MTIEEKLIDIIFELAKKLSIKSPSKEMSKIGEFLEEEKERKKEEKQKALLRGTLDSFKK